MIVSCSWTEVSIILHYHYHSISARQGSMLCLICIRMTYQYGFINCCKVEDGELLPDLVLDCGVKNFISLIANFTETS